MSEWAGQIRQICDCYFIWFITTWIKADCRLRHLYGACPKTSAPESCPQTRRNTQMVMGPTSSCPDSNDPIRHATCHLSHKQEKQLTWRWARLRHAPTQMLLFVMPTTGAQCQWHREEQRRLRVSKCSASHWMPVTGTQCQWHKEKQRRLHISIAISLHGIWR